MKYLTKQNTPIIMGIISAITMSIKYLSLALGIIGLIIGIITIIKRKNNILTTIGLVLCSLITIILILNLMNLIKFV